jgi:hypothetical protein
MARQHRILSGDKSPGALAWGGVGREQSIAVIVPTLVAGAMIPTTFVGDATHAHYAWAWTLPLARAARPGWDAA